MPTYGHVKLIVLSIMFLSVQYQIWGGDVGFHLTQHLSLELAQLKRDNSHIIAANEKIRSIASPESHDEIREDQLRQVYNMVPSGETYVSMD